MINFKKLISENHPLDPTQVSGLVLTVRVFQVQTMTLVCCPGLCRSSLTALKVVCTVASTWSLSAVETSADWLQTSRLQKAAARRTCWGFSKRWDREYRYSYCVRMWRVLVCLFFVFTERQKCYVWKINFSWRSVILFSTRENENVLKTFLHCFLFTHTLTYLVSHESGMPKLSNHINHISVQSAFRFHTSPDVVVLKGSAIKHSSPHSVKVFIISQKLRQDIFFYWGSSAQDP